MKFAIFMPTLNGYWKEDGACVDNWKKAQVFLTREDAETYLNWIKTEYRYKSNYQDLIVRQVE